MEFVQDFYSEKFAGVHADFVCCTMTLEHINETREFLSMVRRALGDRSDVVVFFQVPDVTRVLDECAYWDIYYEHCSHFIPASLSYLFDSTGFTTTNMWTAYDGQYLMIEAKPSTVGDTTCQASEEVAEIRERVDRFVEQVARVREQWTNCLGDALARKLRVALWGAGSKAVAFLTTLDVAHESDLHGGSPARSKPG